MKIVHKSYVYLTCGSQLLVFKEPENPEVGLQVPGGTIDPGESYLIGAKREFEEETGLAANMAFDHFHDQDLPFDSIQKNNPVICPANRPLTGRHLRKLYHARIAYKPEDAWKHYEMTPSNGGPPILFHFFWLDIFSEIAMDQQAFFSFFGTPLDILRQRIKKERV